MAVANILLVGTCIVSVGLLLHIVGMATPHWINFTDESGNNLGIGLFEECYEKQCVKLSNLRSQDKAVQAMAILGALAGCAGLLGTIAFVTLTHAGKNPVSLMRLASGLLCIAAGVFIVILVVVYGAKIFKDVHDEVTIDNYLGYSFGLSTGGGVLLLLGGLVIIAKRGSQDERFTS